MRNSQQIFGWYPFCRGYHIVFALLVLICTIFLLFSSQTSALTTVPTKMNFQGRLTNTSGTIMPNGTYNIKLKLYTVSSGGSAVWTEDRLVSASQGVEVTNGLFAIKLGDVSSLSADLFASGPLYLEVELPTPATATSSSPTWSEGPMTPRNQMATSAYAYNSETLDGIDSSGFIQNTVSPQTANFNITGNGAIGGTLDVTGVTTLASPLTLSYNTITADPATQLIFGNAYDNVGVPSANKIKFYDSAGSTVGIGVSALDMDLFTLQNFNFHTLSSGVLTEDIAVINSTGITSIGTMQGTRLISTVATGTAPLTVSSTTKVVNLNTDTIDGLDSAAFAQLQVANNTFSGTLTLTGNTTINRPANPVEGTVYFDTDTDKLLTYANGKWQADRSDAILVAANNSSQAEKDAADYVADGDAAGAGDGDQVQINAALTAASGKKVVLLAGTYTVDAGVSIPGSTTLSGIGPGSILKNGTAAVPNLTTIVANGTLTSLTLDGNQNINTTDVTGVTSSAVGSIVSRVDIKNSDTGAVITGDESKVLDNTFAGNAPTSSDTVLSVSGNYSTISRNYFDDNGGNGISVSGASHVMVSDNTVYSGSGHGFVTSGTNSYVTFADNISSGNFNDNFRIYGVNSYMTLTGNTARASGSGYGINLGWTTTQDTRNTVVGNTVHSNADGGINVTNSGNMLSNNNMYDNGGTATNFGLKVLGDNNSITGNTIADSSATTSNYALDLASTADSNYLADNFLVSGTINDVGTNTKYSGQLDGSGQSINRSSGGFAIQASTGTNLISTSGTASVNIGTSDTTGTVLVLDTKTDAGDPTGVAGAMYYNSNTGKFRCYQVTTWTDCIPGTSPLQDSYTASTGGTTPEIKLDSTRGGLDIQDADTTIAGSLFAVRGSNSGGIGSALLNISSTGIVTAQNNANSTAAFSINNAAAGSLFVADTTNSRIQIGNATADATGVVLVLDTKNTAGDPTGVDGAMYYNSNLRAFRCFQDSEWRSCIGSMVASNTSTQTIANSATETDFTKNYVIPANNCVPGRVYRITARGVYSTQGVTAPGLTLRVKAGTTTLTTSAVAPTAGMANRQWTLNADVICQTIGVSGTVEAAGTFTRATGAAAAAVIEMSNTAPTTLNTTVAQTLQVSMQWGTAAAANTITLRQMTIESLGP